MYVLLLALVVTSEWMALHDAKRFFELRERLAESAVGDDAERLFLSAAVDHAFNRSESADATIARALELPELDDGLRLKLLRLRRDNAMRRHRYPAALEAARAIASMPSSGGLSSDEERRDDANRVRLLTALNGVPVQTMSASGPTRVTMSKSRAGGPRVPVFIHGRERAYLPDTGANLSVVMQSEAEALDLEVRRARIEVGTSTGTRVEADLAVADHVRIGNHRFRNVVFLVFPDELLTFPEADLRIEGILGFPLFEAMGEIRFRRDDVVEVPASAPERSPSNLALDGLEPLVQVHYDGDPMVCRLDSGASATDFYEPFYRAHRKSVEALGERVKDRTAGVGSVREVDAYRLPAIEIALGKADVRLEGVVVFAESLVEDDANDLFCNIGQDVLGSFDRYIINFESMTFLLE